MKTTTKITSILALALALAGVGCTIENIDQDHNKQCKENCNVVNLVLESKIEPLVPLDSLKEYGLTDLQKSNNWRGLTKLPPPQVVTMANFQWIKDATIGSRLRKKDCKKFAAVFAAGDHFAYAGKTYFPYSNYIGDFVEYDDNGHPWATPSQIGKALQLERQFQLLCREHI